MSTCKIPGETYNFCYGQKLLGWKVLGKVCNMCHEKWLALTKKSQQQTKVY